MADYVGKQFGDYRLIRRLGGGTFGDVYLAVHIGDKTQVAVKVLKTNEEDIEDYINEIRALFRLQHKNIVPLLDFGIKQRIPFLVMDYASNGTLRRPKGTIFPLVGVVILVKQIAEALQYAHNNRIIHRDVKPENILLSPNSQVWLTDFGIAGVAHNKSSLKNQGIAGTMAYMAPEQIQGFPQKASDQYSLGIVVCELICGILPSLFEDLPIFLNKYAPGLPPPVKEVLMTALKKDPDQRFASVRAFATALEQAAKAPTISPPVEPKKYDMVNIQAQPINSVPEANKANTLASPATPESSSNIVELSNEKKTIGLDKPVSDNPSIALGRVDKEDSKLVPNANASAPVESFDEPVSPMPLFAPVIPLSAPPPVAAEPFDDDEVITEDKPVPVEPFIVTGGMSAAGTNVDADDEWAQPALAAPQDIVPYRASAVPISEDEEIESLRPRSKSGPIPIPIALPQTVATTKPLTPGARGANGSASPLRSGTIGKQAAVGAAAVGAGAAAAFAAASHTPVAGGGQPPIIGNTGDGGDRRPRRRSTRRLLTILLVLLSLLLLAGIAFASPPGQNLIGHITGSTIMTAVTITPDHPTVSDSFVVTAVTGTPNPAAQQVQARVVSYTSHQQSASANATGSLPGLPNSVIAQNDIATASHNLILILKPSAQVGLQQQLKPIEQAVSSSLNCTSNVAADHQVGDQARSVTVTGTATCTEVAYDQKGALTIAANALKAEAAKKLGASYVLVGNVVTGVTSATVINTQNTVSLVILAQGVWVYQFIDAIKTSLQNKLVKESESKALADVNATPGVMSAKISISSGTTMPSNPSDITITIVAIPGLSGSPTPTTSPTTVPLGTTPMPGLTPTNGLGGGATDTPSVPGGT